MNDTNDIKETHVQNWGRFLVDAVQSYAEQKNMKFELFSGDWIMRLEKLGSPASKYLFGNDFGLNNTATRGICNDKSACYQVLTREGIPALEHQILLRPGSLGAPDTSVFTLAIDAFNSFNGSVVCKPNRGSGGSDIMFVTTEPELEKALLDLFTNHRAITTSPLITITHEYRICVLDDAVELMYEKVRPEGALQHNLSHGAHAQPITDEVLRKKLTKMALCAAQSLNGTFLHIDIIDTPQGLIVLEVNSGIMFEHYALQGDKEYATATAIYHKALDSLFNKHNT